MSANQFTQPRVASCGDPAQNLRHFPRETRSVVVGKRRHLAAVSQQRTRWWSPAYSGWLLYAMCTGRPPFRADNSYAITRMITDDEPRSIREINPDFGIASCQVR